VVTAWETRVPLDTGSKKHLFGCQVAVRKAAGHLHLHGLDARLLTWTGSNSWGEVTGAHHKGNAMSLPGFAATEPRRLGSSTCAPGVGQHHKCGCAGVKCIQLF
jgi:hypothetical protein